MSPRDGHVRVLPLHVANKIAAGEVVERPASVAKELIENALDAGARKIALTIAGGGRKLVAVQDDGCGMTRDDAILSLERQATSKILDVNDIEEIDTLGFRGEAIPSIASVSRFSITTRRHDADEGTLLVVNAGTLAEVRAAGCPPGTLVEVRDLFCNVPARRKFLRAYATEESHIRQIFTVHALAHPSVAFSLTVDGRELYRLAPAATLADRVRELFGTEFLESLLPLGDNSSSVSGLPSPLASRVSCLATSDVADEGERHETRDASGDLRRKTRDIAVTGYIERPNLSLPTRRDQYVFVNGRPASAPSVAYALREAYPQQRGESRPATILFITLPPGEVDVNVHPTKREVRFRNGSDVKLAIMNAVGQALGQGRGLGQGQGVRQETRDASVGQGVRQETRDASVGQGVRQETRDASQRHETVDASEASRVSSLASPLASHASCLTPSVSPGLASHASCLTPSVSPGLASHASGLTPSASPDLASHASGLTPSASPDLASHASRLTPSASPDLASHASRLTPSPSPAPVQVEFAVDRESVASRPWVWFKYLATTASGYLLLETDAGVVTVNPMAARERIAFERLSAGDRAETPIQTLLIPDVVHLSPVESARIASALAEIRAMGFRLEPFGRDTWKIEAVPQILGEMPPAAILATVARDLADGSIRRTGEKWRETLVAKSVARSFAGTPIRLDEQSATRLVEELAACRMPYVCPRGKPIMIFTSTRELNRKFARD